MPDDRLIVALDVPNAVQGMQRAAREVSFVTKQTLDTSTLIA